MTSAAAHNRELAAAARSMPRSGIREIMDLAWSTPDVIHLEVGEPNFPTPDHAVEAAVAAARAGATRYTPNAGIPELRAALARKVENRNGVPAAPDRVVVTSGAVEALYSTLLSLLDPGDGLILPDPGWPNFRMMANLLDAEVQPYALRAEDGYLPTVEAVERAITPDSKVLLLNSPSNPLGTVLGRDGAQQLYELARAHDLWILSDECYDELVFDGSGYSIGADDPDERVISVYSFSKTYAMTGWRVGYAVVPDRLAETLAKLQEPIISCVSAPSQHAALAAVDGPQDVVGEMLASYRERRDLVAAQLEGAGIPSQRPAGAFYVWVDVSGSGLDARSFARTLVSEDAVAVVPGTAFGDVGAEAVRLSLATDPSLLADAVGRLVHRHQRLQERA